MTQRWWGAERANYELVTSQYVLDEAADGDSALAQSRLETLAGVPILPVEGAILDIAEEILRKGEDARKRQAASGHEIWRPKPKPSAASPSS